MSEWQYSAVGWKAWTLELGADSALWPHSHPIQQQ